MNTKSIIASIVIAVGLVGGAFFVRASGDKPETPQTPETKSATTQKSEQKVLALSELEGFDGKDGKECYVAVDDKVYEIEQGRLWKEGEHTTSAGQAHCGKDLTEAMARSPHGKSKLEALEVVGSLKKD